MKKLLWRRTRIGGSLFMRYVRQYSILAGALNSCWFWMPRTQSHCFFFFFFSFFPSSCSCSLSPIICIEGAYKSDGIYTSFRLACVLKYLWLSYFSLLEKGPCLSFYMREPLVVFFLQLLLLLLFQTVLAGRNSNGIYICIHKLDYSTMKCQFIIVAWGTLCVCDVMALD